MPSQLLLGYPLWFRQSPPTLRTLLKVAFRFIRDMRFTNTNHNRHSYTSESDLRTCEATYKQLQRKPRKNPLPTRLTIHSSVGRASHQYRGGHGFKSPWSLRIFSGLSLQLLKLLHNCEDHFHLYSLSAVHIYDVYHMCITTDVSVTPLTCE